MDEIIGSFPQQWQEIVALLLAPIAWIPKTQQVLLDFFQTSESVWVAMAKYVLLLFPALLGLAALWCTQLSIYTLPFRSGRSHFVSAMLLAWWDAARAVWLYWIGLVRCAGVLVGGIVLAVGFLVRLTVEALRKVAMMPFLMTGRMAERYFQPGVPWVAFVALLLWCVLEASVFTHVLFPTVTEVLSRLAETPEPARATGPLLFVFLYLLVLGSFACAQALVEATRTREVKYVGQMLAVEVFVLFFEVMFLYREIVAAFLPALAENRLAVIGVATAGWIGVRGMTWFLFGQYGTAPLMAFISRRPLMPAENMSFTATAVTPVSWWAEPMQDFRRETEWLHAASDRMLGYLALPAMHIAAAAVNFGMVLVAGKPVFSLPFKHLDEIPESRSILAGLHLQPRKSSSAS
jgi:hypothetical protein